MKLLVIANLVALGSASIAIVAVYLQRYRKLVRTHLGRIPRYITKDGDTWRLDKRAMLYLCNHHIAISAYLMTQDKGMAARTSDTLHRSRSI